MSPSHLPELEAIEAAVAGDRSDTELALIVGEARAGAPAMTPQFTERLDAAVRGGFAVPARRRRLSLGPALGLAGASAVAVAVAISVVPGGGGTQVTQSPPSASSPASPYSASGAASTPAPEAVVPKAAAPSTAQRDSAVPSAPGARVQERAAQLTLTTPAQRLQDTADQVVAVTDRMGGYVQSSNVAARGRQGEASFDLRVPASRLNEALAALSRLGHVRGRSEQAQDITAAYNSAKSRLHDAEAERQGLLRALAAATTTQQIESIKARLRLVRDRIAAASTDLASVRHRASYSRVGVTLLAAAHSGAVAHHGGSPWTPGRALHDAGRVLSVAAGVAIVAAAAALPAALLALLALLGARAMRRRRREAALDGMTAAL